MTAPLWRTPPPWRTFDAAGLDGLQCTLTFDHGCGCPSTWSPFMQHLQASGRDMGQGRCGARAAGSPQGGVARWDPSGDWTRGLHKLSAPEQLLPDARHACMLPRRSMLSLQPLILGCLPSFFVQFSSWPSSSRVVTSTGDALYGVAPVLAALAGGRRTAHALYIQEGGCACQGLCRQLRLCSLSWCQAAGMVQMVGIPTTPQFSPAAQHDRTVAVRANQSRMTGLSRFAVRYTWWRCHSYHVTTSPLIFHPPWQARRAGTSRRWRRRRQRRRRPPCRWRPLASTSSTCYATTGPTRHSFMMSSCCPP